MNLRHLFIFFLLFACRSESKKTDIDVKLVDQQIKRYVPLAGVDKVKAEMLLDSLWNNAFQTNNRLLISRALFCKAIAFENKGNYDSALNYYKSSLSLKKEIGDNEGLAEVHMSIARYYSLFGQLKMQESYLSEARKYILPENTSSLINWYTDMAYCYSQKEDLANTKSYFKKALDLAEKTKAKQLLIARENYGSVFNQMEQIDSAKYYYKMCLAEYIAKKDTMNLAATYHNIALIYWYSPHSDSVQLYLEKAYQLSKSTQKQAGLEMYLKSLSDFWEDEGDFKMSRQYLSELDSFRTTHFQSDLAKSISDIEKNYLVKSQKEENATLKAQLQLKNIVRNASIVTALLLIVILLYQIKNSKQKRQLIEKEKSIKDQEIDRLLKEVEIVGVTSVIEGGEQEKQRIGRDLHDRLGSMLSIAKLHLSSGKSDDDAAHKKAIQILDEAVAEVRRIAHDLNSSFLVSNGLSAALFELKKTLDSTGKIQLNIFETTENNRMSSEFEIALFRIIQEAISNVLKHSEASKVDLHITSTLNAFTLIVEDNGKGFDHAKNGRGIGLMNIKQRVSALNGELTIDSKIGKGTTLIVEFEDINRNQ